MNHAIAQYRNAPPVTLRWATPADAHALGALAELDEARVPAAPVLLAFVDDELWVAMSLSSGELISDPFRRTSEVSALVVERGRQLKVPDRYRFALVGRLRRVFALSRQPAAPAA